MSVDSAIQESGRIGILTGSGPDAGLDLWAKVLAANKRLRGPAAFRGDVDAPAVVIHSVPALGWSMDLEAHHEAVHATMLEACAELGAACSVFGVSCNTLHLYAEDMALAGRPATFVSMVELTVEACAGRERVALLGSRTTMALDGPWSAYTALRGVVGEVELPDAAAQVALHELIYDIKRIGAEACVPRWRALLAELEAPTVVLACTELPLVAAADPRAATERFLDPTALLAEGLVRHILP